jgi:hypothetical protein
MKIKVEIDVGPDLSMHKHIRMLELLWKECPHFFNGLKILEPQYGGVPKDGLVMERPNPYSDLERLESVFRKLERLDKESGIYLIKALDEVRDKIQELKSEQARKN